MNQVHLGDMLALLKRIINERTVTFAYAASEKEFNCAVDLKEFLERGKN